MNTPMNGGRTTPTTFEYPQHQYKQARYNQSGDQMGDTTMAESETTKTAREACCKMGKKAVKAYYKSGGINKVQYQQMLEYIANHRNNTEKHAVFEMEMDDVDVEPTTPDEWLALGEDLCDAMVVE
jgi:hypothetical protein